MKQFWPRHRKVNLLTLKNENWAVLQHLDSLIAPRKLAKNISHEITYVRMLDRFKRKVQYTDIAYRTVINVFTSVSIMRKPVLVVRTTAH